MKNLFTGEKRNAKDLNDLLYVVTFNEKLDDDLKKIKLFFILTRHSLIIVIIVNVTITIAITITVTVTVITIDFFSSFTFTFTSSTTLPAAE